MGSEKDSITTSEEQCDSGEIVSSCADTSEMKYEDSIENIGVNTPVSPETFIKASYPPDKVSCYFDR